MEKRPANHTEAVDLFIVGEKKNRHRLYNRNLFRIKNAEDSRPRGRFYSLIRSNWPHHFLFFLQRDPTVNIAFGHIAF